MDGMRKFVEARFEEQSSSLIDFRPLRLTRIPGVSYQEKASVKAERLLFKVHFCHFMKGATYLGN